jgi:CheY-like chemotaxis protein
MMNLILHCFLILVWKIKALQLMPLMILYQHYRLIKLDYYRIAILDIKMPKMNGFELGSELKKINNKIKISFISAFDIQEENLKYTVP